MHLQCGRLNVDKKAFLWAIFFVQVCLIGVVLLFSVLASKSQPQQHKSSIASDADSEPHSDGVGFVQRLVDAHKAEHNDERVRIVTSGRREHEFIGKQHCFRDGLARRPAADDIRTASQSVCVCKPDYHGSDCGQPEVLWRAFMTARMPLKTGAISRRRPHNIVYLIQPAAGGVVQLETLEIQVLELVHVVDLFVLCGHANELRQAIRNGPLAPFFRKILVVPSDSAATVEGCSLRYMYVRLRQQFAAAAAKDNTVVGNASTATVRSDDVLLVSGPDEILNWRAVKYFKWYDHWPQPAQFRLKYLVYGYYWQHPQSTWLAAAAGQLSVLEEVHRGDPHRLVAATKPGMIVGDLNHVGGWYCQYCYHPMNVVRRLDADRGTSVANHNASNAAAIDAGGTRLDAGRVEKLIANGLFVDGKLGLMRLHRFADKYYAPECVRNASWRYENLLSNVYATYDDDDYAN